MAKKKISPIESLKNKIESEGFDYAVSEYSEWGEILDQEFHRMREAYIEIRTSFQEYVDSMYESDDEENEYSDE